MTLIVYINNCVAILQVCCFIASVLLYYNEEVLEWVNQYKYLGVTFSSRNVYSP